MKNRIRDRLLAIAFGFAVAAVLGVVLFGLAEGLARLVTQGGERLRLDGGPWRDHFEYLTVGDAELGVIPRPGARSTSTRGQILVNRSGVRDATTDATVPPRRDDELLVLVAGDSNAFGYMVDHGETYAALLERALERLTDRRVRVVNLGVSGYTSLQAELRLARWMRLEPDFVVFGDSFNDRTAGRPMRRDNIAALTSDYRIWELGDRVSYALLYLAKSVDVEGPPRPTLGGERPTVSVSRSAFEDVLERVVALARRSGAQPILLTTGDDPEDTAVAHRGLAYLDRGDPVAAAAEFELLVRTNPDQFLGWFLLDRARVALGEDPSALRARYAESLAGLAYIDTFAWYADEYLPVLRAVAEREGVPLVDLRETFRRENVRFFDVCHFGPKGHRLIARALADVIAARLDRREGRGGADAATDSTG